jgi:predicted metal-dependent phosphoesterase TrpH
MIPPLIVRTALEQDIDLIAITDHNTSANVKAVQKAAEGTRLSVLPGMELQTKEEIHLLCIFDRMDDLQKWQEIVDKNLPERENMPDYFGEQFIVDESGDFLDREKRLLINSAQISLDESVAEIHRLGGLAIPAHVNRQAFGLFANLGMIPQDVPIDAIEISRHITPTQACAQFPQIENYALIQNGDVHFLSDFLGSSYFWIESPSLEEIRLALHAELNRKIEIRTDQN